MTVISDQTQLDLRTPIQQFYSGQNVFITGGTGFLGKILIEKLLRSCSDLSSIYVLIRPKKNQDVHQRVENIFDDPIFERLKSEMPKFRHKIVAVAGDCSCPGLGLSAPDRELLLREITIVFNVAATVRFDEKLRQAVAINVGGTKETLELGRRMHNLRAIIHVSTAYSNCNRKDIDEKFYDAPISGDNMIQLVQSLDDGKLDAITETLLDDFPNTYTYTKCIAEQVIQQHGKDLPIGIFRPAIVISSYREPVEGWIDNVYGPTGALVGGGAGLIRTVNIDENCTAELIPVDMTVNALIATAWDVANNKNEAADPPIYNYHSSWSSSLTWGQYVNLAFKHGKRIPSMRSIWCYSMVATKSYLFYYILTILLHLLPALLVDVGLFVTGHKTSMLKIYKKIHKFSMVTTYFSTNKWKFGFDNTRELWENLTPGDQKLFFFSMKDFDWEDFMVKCVSGVRIYVFKDDPSTIPMARKRMARFLIMHRFIKLTSIAFAAWLLYTLYTFASSIGSSCGFSTALARIERGHSVIKGNLKNLTKSINRFNTLDCQLPSEPNLATYEDLLKSLEGFGDQEIEKITPRTLRKWPDTYIFTTDLAETVIKDRSNGINMGIFRPAVSTISIVLQVLLAIGIFLLTLLGRIILFVCAMIYTVVRPRQARTDSSARAPFETMYPEYDFEDDMETMTRVSLETLTSQDNLTASTVAPVREPRLPRKSEKLLRLKRKPKFGKKDKMISKSVDVLLPENDRNSATSDNNDNSPPTALQESRTSNTESRQNVNLQLLLNGGLFHEVKTDNCGTLKRVSIEQGCVDVVPEYSQ